MEVRIQLVAARTGIHGGRSATRQVIVRPVRPSSPGASLTDRPHDPLLLRVADGDRSAFHALYRTLGPVVLGYLTRTSGEPEVARELLQEVFLSVWRNAHRFDPRRASAKTWVFTIARNRMLDRRRRVRVRRAAPDDPQWVEEPERSDVIVEQAQDAARVHGALQELPTTQRDVLTRSFFAFQSYTEIAGELDVAVGTVKSRARLGFRRLRQLLEDPE